ncbi:MAG: 4Fe-4S binding protein [Ignavibacteriaceae bacterium]
MNYSLLRKIRIVVSLLFLLSTSVLFLDITNLLPQWIYKYVTFLQFIPSSIKFFSLFIFSSIGFIIVLILSLLFGRVYCSSICPLGTLQDISSYVSQKIKKRKKFIYSKEKTWLRYSILALVVIPILFGNLFLVNLLDPYSNFGRILAQIINPLIIAINNLAAFTLEKLDVYTLYPIEIKTLYLSLTVFPLIFLSIVLYLSYTKGRLYCNTICPVGTLLGLVSKFTIFKLKIDKASCEGCGVCARVCKSGCIDKTTKNIDFSRCVACYDCMIVCPSDSINYQISNITINNDKADESRRDFISRTSLFIVGLTSSALAQIKIIPQKESKVKIKKNSVVSPPGSISTEHFTSTCTACHLCISSCPTKVLQPSLTEWGMFNIFQPFMDYNTSFCNYECNVCSDVCPTGAIIPIIAEKKKLTQLGKAIFVKENCIVETENTACGACSEHCPTKAVQMVDYKNGLKIPEVTDKYCIGCGACEFACPVRPFKAIYVDGHLVHQVAEKKPTEKLDQNIDYKEEFPF